MTVSRADALAALGVVCLCVAAIMLFGVGGLLGVVGAALLAIGIQEARRARTGTHGTS